ncbi:MAG: aspartate/glutamate racemase family protein [Rhodanobacteraceae bacterium]
MNKIGILGGIGWMSTAEYYEGVCRLVEERHRSEGLSGVVAMPEIAIESLDLASARAYFGHDGHELSWSEFDRYHRDGLLRLQTAGADFAVIASNTPHLRLRQITRGVKLPVLSIVEAAAAACVDIGVTHVLILGSAGIMRSRVFRDAFAQRGIHAESPDSERSRRIVTATIRGVELGHLDGAAKRIHTVATGPGARHLPESSAVYLGCTELSLVFPAYRNAGVFEYGGVRYLNSTALHIHATFDRASEALWVRAAG